MSTAGAKRYLPPIELTEIDQKGLRNTVKSVMISESYTGARRSGDVNDPVFDLDHLSLSYPGGRAHPAVDVLNDVSFTVERGRALTLVGPSGSGKSSVLRCLNRLVEPTSGTVRFDGHDTRSVDPRELRCRAALVMQTPIMFEGTVRDNLCIRFDSRPTSLSVVNNRSSENFSWLQSSAARR